MKLHWHKPGMRNIKTAVAVTLCYFIFLPFWDPSGEVGPFYACIASVICMQDSVEKSFRQGVSRTIGTLLGGLVGLVILFVDDSVNSNLLLGLMLGAGCVAVIWLCNLIGRSSSSSLGCVVLSVVLINHGGVERYIYFLSRVVETVVGIAVAVAVNHLLPDFRKPE